MNLLKNKNIVLCITGGIAAYKAVSLASFLSKKGANIFAVLTKHATKFITPLTFKTITKNKVTTDMFDESDFIPHISLAELADIVLVAPATANIIAKAAAGIADDIVSTLLLSTDAKKIIIPAMNTKMYLNPITQQNINKLSKNNFNILPPDIGFLACRDEGVGRFPTIEKIYGFIKQTLSHKLSFLLGKKVLVTLGGTIEDIDPVRFITNRSSGKMGFAFVEQLHLSGANVTIIAGNVNENDLKNFKLQYDTIKIERVRSASEMYSAVINSSNDFDIYIMAAAVADFTAEKKDSKIKKDKTGALSISLSATKDILATLPKRKGALYVGFCAESKDLLNEARKKLTKKNIDFIVANKIIGEKNAIGGVKAEVFLLNKWNNNIKKIEYDTKKNIAYEILNFMEDILKEFDASSDEV